MPNITLKNFSKSYKGNAIYSSVDCTFEMGRISLIIGENGSGKTTLAKCISRLEDYEGEIALEDGLSYEDLMVIWDDTPFYNNLSGFDNIMVMCPRKVTKAEIAEKAKSIMEYELLKQKVGQYSYGQRKKLALVLSEVVSPKILIMDEITNGLDRVALRRLKELMVARRNDRLTIVTGHQLHFYNDIIDDLYIINDKKPEKRYDDFKNMKLDLEEVYDTEFYEA